MSCRGLHHGGCDDAGGFSIIESVVAISLFAIVATALAAAAGSALGLVTTSNSRQTATQIAVQQIEQLRSRSFSALGHSTALPTSNDPNSPDRGVDSTGTKYTIPGKTKADGSALVENISIEPTRSTVHHPPQPLIRGGTSFEVYTYITETDDASTVQNPDLKRATIVITWAGNSDAVPVNSFSLSSVFSSGSVGFGAGSIPPPPAGGGGGDGSGPPPAACVDLVAPSNATMAIAAQADADAGWTNSSSITLALGVTDDCVQSLEVHISDDGLAFVPVRGAFSSYPCTAIPCVASTSLSHPLPAVEGPHSVQLFYKDAAGRFSPTVPTPPAVVKVDSIFPTAMANVRAVKGTYGNGSNAVLGVGIFWNPSSDVNLVGYHIYRRVGGVLSKSQDLLQTIPFGNGNGKCGSSGTCTYIDPSGGQAQPAPQSGTEYIYVVGAYDRAGNETLSDPQTVSF